VLDIDAGLGRLHRVVDRLSLRSLNRATLERQFLLERTDASAAHVIRHLVGLQAQEPRDPYIGLWSRRVGFRVEDLEELLTERAVVRLVVQRGTVHAIVSADCFLLARLARPILTQQLHTHRDHGPLVRDVDLDAAMAVAAEILAPEPLSTRRLREALSERFPMHDAAALAFACRNLLALVQVPPRGLWSRSGQVVGTTAEAWLGRPDDGVGSVDDVMLRYLAAFGPATVRDAATWSKYTGLREVFDRLKPRLDRFVDEDGTEYVDLPDAPRPDPDVPAPVRFLPQYDNLLLAHANRRRFITRDLSGIWMGQTGFVGSLLVDGTLRGMWRFDHPHRHVVAGESSTLTITTSPKLTRAEATDVLVEAEAFVSFVAPAGGIEIRLDSA
jgi:hypothetical protein